ncbi:DUF4288 domain-containing protein [Flavisolibacter nicotianae]|uniref:DUF4288 domain-containing protein n=1 Tax=Flavisolibacter nicotianae TaxID=2364882 RepID=UPI000EB1AFBE|nr:DUF4288 domain-containing protein [Flavisolibacter nicotianae]
MNWFTARIVYQIICGDGAHTPQFDEQIRLISAADLPEALEKAGQVGLQEEVVFYNDQEKLVQWKFVDIAEIYALCELSDGAEIYSHITEVDDADDYVRLIQRKAAFLQERITRQQLHLI